MATLRDLNNAAESCVTWPRDSTRMCNDGEFGATAKLGGIIRIYVLRGELDDPQAEIVRHVDVISQAAGSVSHRAFVGDRLFGGVPAQYSSEAGWR